MLNFTSTGNLSSGTYTPPTSPPNTVYYKKFNVDPATELSGYIDLPGLEGINITGDINLDITSGISQKEGRHYSVVNDSSGYRRRLTWNPVEDPTLTEGLMGVISDGDIEFISFLAVV